MMGRWNAKFALIVGKIFFVKAHLNYEGDNGYLFFGISWLIMKTFSSSEELLDKMEIAWRKNYH